MAISLNSWQNRPSVIDFWKQRTSPILPGSRQRRRYLYPHFGFPAWRPSVTRIGQMLGRISSKTGKWACAKAVAHIEYPEFPKKIRILEYRLTLSISLFFLGSGIAWADAANTPEDTGFTVLSNATNVTQWGLGVGLGVEPSPYKGDGARITPIPLFSVENKWISAFATTLDLKVGQWGGIALAMRGRVGILDGYRASDAPILNGMQNRDSPTFWYGPELSWHSEFGTLAASYLIGGNKGQQATVDFTKAFEFANWTIGPHAEIKWASAKYVDYYFGVPSSEARPDRPAYDGTSALTTTFGTRISYQILPRQSVSIDLQLTYLGNGITASPLVGKRFIPAARVAYLYRFK